MEKFKEPIAVVEIILGALGVLAYFYMLWCLISIPFGITHGINAHTQLAAGASSSNTKASLYYPLVPAPDASSTQEAVVTPTY